MIPTEAIEAAAQALYRTEYADRDLTDALANVQSAYRADARAVLSAALPFLGAAQSATREDVDLTAVIEAVWDAGNATGLDGWTGPGRGSDEVDDYALRARERAVLRALDAITPRTDR